MMGRKYKLKNFRPVKGAFLFFFSVLMAFCTHNENIVKPVDTHLQKQDAIGEEDIGVTRDKELIIQKKQTLSRVLEEQIWRNKAILDSLESFSFKLDDCYTYLIDPRLGGNSEVFEMPQLDPIVENPMREEIGYDSYGEYKVVHKEYYQGRLKTERAKELSLKKMEKVLAKSYKSCKALLIEARLRYGLPGEKYPAVTGKNRFGRLIILRKAEKNLDDAFEIKRFLSNSK